MGENTFFVPTPLFKEFMILDLIDNNKDITQREIGNTIGVAVSMVNKYLSEYESNGLIERKYLSSKTIEYYVTKKGSERKKVLNIGYLRDSQALYDSARVNIEKYIMLLESAGIKKIFLYGAGEVAQILVHTFYTSEKCVIKILGIIDDDEHKIGKTIYGFPIVDVQEVFMSNNDGILISSYSNRNKIMGRLKALNFDQNKIFTFFDL